MKIAVVHDWLATYAGAERVLEQILLCFPDADLFALVDFIDGDLRAKHFLNKHARTTFIQKLPFAKKKFRAYLSLMPFAIEQLDLSAYDVIISSSHAVAKGVITGPNQLHISYTNSFMRYAWDLQSLYLKQSGLICGLRSYLVRKVLHKIRMWDAVASGRVDRFVANSAFCARLIQKFYRRNAEIIYPSVNVDFFEMHSKKSDFFLTVSRLVPYKKVDIIVKAFSRLPSYKLVVIGDGPEITNLKKQATSNIEFLGKQPPEIVKKYAQEARCFIFASEEIFGIAPLEAQACGTPVIAYNRGGACETVNDLSTDKPTGIFFDEQNVDSLLQAIAVFDKHSHLFKPENCRNNSLRFAAEIFRQKFTDFVMQEWLKYRM